MSLELNHFCLALPGSVVVLVVKKPPVNAGDMRDTGLIPGSGRSPRGRHGNPLQYSFLGNPHGQRSLVGYSLQGYKDSDTTEVTEHAASGDQTNLCSLTLAHSLHFLVLPLPLEKLFFFFFPLNPTAYGILVPQPGIELMFPALEGDVLNTGPLRKSPSE